jgi:hypothetical protein
MTTEALPAFPQPFKVTIKGYSVQNYNYGAIALGGKTSYYNGMLSRLLTPYLSSKISSSRTRGYERKQCAWWWCVCVCVCESVSVCAGYKLASHGAPVYIGGQTHVPCTFQVCCRPSKYSLDMLCALVIKSPAAESSEAISSWSWSKTQRQMFDN